MNSDDFEGAISSDRPSSRKVGREKRLRCVAERVGRRPLERSIAGPTEDGEIAGGAIRGDEILIAVAVQVVDDESHGTAGDRQLEVRVEATALRLVERDERPRLPADDHEIAEAVAAHIADRDAVDQPRCRHIQRSEKAPIAAPPEDPQPIVVGRHQVEGAITVHVSNGERANPAAGLVVGPDEPAAPVAEQNRHARSLERHRVPGDQVGNAIPVQVGDSDALGHAAHRYARRQAVLESGELALVGNPVLVAVLTEVGGDVLQVFSPAQVAVLGEHACRDKDERRSDKGSHALEESRSDHVDTRLGSKLSSSFHSHVACDTQVSESAVGSIPQAPNGSPGGGPAWKRCASR